MEKIQNVYPSLTALPEGHTPHASPYLCEIAFTTFRVSASHFPRAALVNGRAAVSGGPRSRTESQLRAY